MRRVLLADCDAFFVQVARLEDPDGAGKEPLLLVGGSPEGRGVVTSASYEVRKFGVRSGMPMARALRLCPRAKRVGVPRGACMRKHREIRAVLDRFTPVVQAASIDEFYLDLTGTEELYKGASLAEVATRIREAVFAETQVQISIGGGPARLVAKLAVRKAKPAGVHIVDPAGVTAFMQALPLAAIPGIGPRFQEKLKSFGLVTVADTLPFDRAMLATWFGQGTGDWLYDRIRGIDESRVETREMQKSISRDETFARDIMDDARLERELLVLAGRAGRDLRDNSLRARTVTVRLRDHDFTTRQASHTVQPAIETDRAIFGVARKLLACLRAKRRTSARLIGVSLSNLVAHDAPPQLGLFAETTETTLETEKDRRVARVMDDVRGRFGSDSIRPGRTLS